jgi:hypothetical protein
VAQGKDVIGEARSIGIVLFDTKVGFMIEEPVEHVRGVANSGVDDLGVERSVLIRNVRVE